MFSPSRNREAFGRPGGGGRRRPWRGRPSAESSAGVSRLSDSVASGSPRRNPRICISTGEAKEKSELLRFVMGPNQRVVPDLKQRLPGRGAWISCRRDLVEKAVSKRLLSRALGAKATEDLPDQVDSLLESDALSALSMARKAGLAVTGMTKCDSALRSGSVRLALHAREAARDGQEKLRKAARAGLADSADSSESTESVDSLEPKESTGRLDSGDSADSFVPADSADSASSAESCASASPGESPGSGDSADSFGSSESSASTDSVGSPKPAESTASLGLLASGGGREVLWSRIFPSERLDMALGGSNVIHVALLSGGATENLIERIARLERFRRVGCESERVAEERKPESGKVKKPI